MYSSLPLSPCVLPCPSTSLSLDVGPVPRLEPRKVLARPLVAPEDGAEPHRVPRERRDHVLKVGRGRVQVPSRVVLSRSVPPPLAPRVPPSKTGSSTVGPGATRRPSLAPSPDSVRTSTPPVAPVPGPAEDPTDPGPEAPRGYPPEVKEVEVVREVLRDGLQGLRDTGTSVAPEDSDDDACQTEGGERLQGVEDPCPLP